MMRGRAGAPKQALRRSIILGAGLAALGVLALLFGCATSPVVAGTGYVCPTVPATQKYTFVYGSAVLDGLDAAPGSVVEARDPRGNTVGCQTVEPAGKYALMYVYGADTVAGTSIPGMHSGESVAFALNGNPATAAPAVLWSNDWASHRSDLNARAPTPTPTPTRTPAPPVTPAGVSIAVSGADLLLSWQPVTQDIDGNAITASGYRVYRSATDPYFAPLPGAPLATPVAPSHRDIGSAGGSSNFYYCVRAAGPGDLLSAISRRVGCFKFGLTPGQ